MATCVEAIVIFTDSGGNESAVTVRGQFDDAQSVYKAKVELAADARDLVRTSSPGELRDTSGPLQFKEATYKVWDC